MVSGQRSLTRSHGLYPHHSRYWAVFTNSTAPAFIPLAVNFTKPGGSKQRAKLDGKLKGWPAQSGRTQEQAELWGWSSSAGTQNRLRVSGPPRWRCRPTPNPFCGFSTSQAVGRAARWITLGNIFAVGSLRILLNLDLPAQTSLALWSSPAPRPPGPLNSHAEPYDASGPWRRMQHSNGPKRTEM